MSWLSRPSLFLRVFGHLRLAVRLLRDPAVSVPLKVMPLVAGLYVLVPFDFVPDLLPVLGQLDDLAVVALATETFIGWCPSRIVAYHRAAMADGRRYSPMPADGPVIDAEFRRD